MVHNEKGFENLVLKNVPETAISRIINNINIPQEIIAKFSDQRERLFNFFVKQKGNWGIADFIVELKTEDEFPQWIKEMVIGLKQQCL